MLPLQQPALTTRDARKTPWNVLVALSSEGTATGNLYLDDGESLRPNSTLYVELAATSRGGSRLWASGRGGYVDGNVLGNVTVLGVGSVGEVRFNGVKVNGSCVGYDQGKGVLTVTGFGEAVGSAWGEDWVLSW